MEGQNLSCALPRRNPARICELLDRQRTVSVRRAVVVDSRPSNREGSEEAPVATVSAPRSGHQPNLKVSCTVADLQSSDEITAEHVSEAIQYRTFDRTLWV